MNEVTLTPASGPLTGNLQVPGDKSISHRAVILGSLARGTTNITNFLTGEDCMRTIGAFRQFGVSIEQNDTSVKINSNGPDDFKEPAEPLYYGNSGTTARLMVGVLAGLPFFTSVYGDPSLASRPMDRVVTPLKKMGARFDGRSDGTYLPLAVRGGNLKGIHYILPVKSAQVKSAILFGGLFAEGPTEVIEKSPSRNHSENMLRAFGADIAETNHRIRITSQKPLTAADVHVPGDISSAAFFMTAAAIVPGSKLTLSNVGLNHTRTGIMDVLAEMGASVDVSNKQTIGGETFGDVTVTYQKLKGAVIEGDIIPRLIDELPIIALAATQAEGETVIRDAAELRLKETDRIKATADGLTRLGAQIKPTEDGMIIKGDAALTGGKTAAYNDHRIAMMLSIASLITKQDVIIDDISSIAISYPEFFRDLQTISSKR
ncbi:3-phosphoshikimate 1-carboxyvinyltransferase [Lentibacillus halodurans]|uniref:3-phosphoshikimate 1-carboxyvinyltransferase n=1 Tax=Lentibacillus halodurans TaxID=237679 RepID=A0A1I0VBY9_9BACI|nr:3-phosphoshikimate 1-carboxyvinyltransferase [Lentibacillus halodurans]SFA73884.1 3-phosphoshikimate 1-carboxyvinyltransferase [Lentibacillus halodurans]